MQACELGQSSKGIRLGQGGMRYRGSPASFFGPEFALPLFRGRVALSRGTQLTTEPFRCLESGKGRLGTGLQNMQVPGYVDTFVKLAEILHPLDVTHAGDLVDKGIYRNHGLTIDPVRLRMAVGGQGVESQFNLEEVGK